MKAALYAQGLYDPNLEWLGGDLDAIRMALGERLERGEGAGTYAYWEITESGREAVLLFDCRAEDRFRCSKLAVMWEAFKPV